MLDKTSVTALAPGRGAIITGGASGINRAREDLLSVPGGGAAAILTAEADVTSPSDLAWVADAAFSRFDDIAFLMNNAASFQGGDALSDPAAWRRTLDVNVLGAINGIQCIGRTMIDRGKRAQSSTRPPSKALPRRRETRPTTVSKAAVKTLTYMDG